MKTFTFDIETVPIEKLDEAQNTEYRKVMNNLKKKWFPNGDYKLSDLKNLRNLGRSVSPFLGKICVIGIHYKDDAGNVQTEAIHGYDERQILLTFWKYVAQFEQSKPGLFISFNGLGFDVPFILKRSMFHRIVPSSNSFLDQRRFSVWPHFDVKMVIGDWDKFATGTLDLITNFLSIPSPKEGKVAAKDVYDAYKNGRLKDVADYCERDVVATYEVYDVVKDFVFNPFKKRKG